ncbi:MAG: hypothetical protein KC445_15380 [Anaerolineales bacterium]|nr:hypothetical protein [Anaerolineales bacterium]
MEILRNQIIVVVLVLIGLQLLEQFGKRRVRELQTAVLLAGGLFFAQTALFVFTGINLVYVLIFATALWAAWDSSRIGLRRYKSIVSYGPIGLFFAISFLWPIAFPLYLAMKFRIRQGIAEVKPAVPVGASLTRLDDR